MSGDLTITHAHRTALRRVVNGQRLEDLASVGPALVKAGLLYPISADLLSGYAITDEGRALLTAHDAATRRLPRPAPALPTGWREDGTSLVHRDVEHPVSVALLRVDSDVALTRAIRQTEAMLNLLRWEQGRRVLARLVDLREQGAAVTP